MFAKLQNGKKLSGTFNGSQFSKNLKSFQNLEIAFVFYVYLKSSNSQKLREYNMMTHKILSCHRELLLGFFF